MRRTHNKKITNFKYNSYSKPMSTDVQKWRGSSVLGSTLTNVKRNRFLLNASRLLVGIGVLIAFMRFGIIHRVIIDDGTALGTQRGVIGLIETDILQQLEKQWYRKFKPLLRVEDLQQSYLLKYPEITSLEFRVTDDTALRVFVALREPVAIYMIAAATNNNTSSPAATPVRYLDRSGTVFSLSDMVDNSLNMPTIIDAGSIGEELPQPIPPTLLEFITDVHLLAQSRQGVSAFASHSWQYVISSSPRQVTLRAEDVGFEIYLNTERGVSDQIGEYNQVIDYLSNNNLALPSRYVDLRIDDTAYYQ